MKEAERSTAADALRELQAWLTKYEGLPVIPELMPHLRIIGETLLAASMPSAYGGAPRTDSRTEFRLSPQDGGTPASERSPMELTDATPDDTFLTAQEVAEMLGLDPSKLRNDRYFGEGLPYCKPMGKVLYKLADVTKVKSGRGQVYSRARFNAAVRKWRGKLTTAQREDLIAHVQAAMWD